jgi:hypothetical protein
MDAVDEMKAAQTEALFRDVNERIAEQAAKSGSNEAQFVCECSDPRCTNRFHATLEEYDRVRERGDRFLLVHGHEAPPAVEKVVERRERFEIVRKVRELGALARRLDPRQ